MQVYGVDLAAWYAEGRWVGLLDLIDGLPTACRLNEAIANDPESADYLAAQRLENKGEGEEWTPPVREFDLTAHLLRDVITELKQVKQALTVQVTQKPPPPEKPFPLPRTAIDRAIERLEHQWAEDFLGQFGFDSSDI